MKALVVEPVPEIRESIIEFLGKEGFEVDGTDNAKTGFSLINQNRYDFITSNAWSYDGSGLAMIRAIRAKGIDDPILMCSARCNWQDFVIGYLAGADDYMSFPFHFEDFSLAVKRLMSGQDQPKENEIFEVREQLLKSHEKGSLITDTDFFRQENKDWTVPNEVENGPLKKKKG